MRVEDRLYLLAVDYLARYWYVTPSSRNNKQRMLSPDQGWQYGAVRLSCYGAGTVPVRFFIIVRVRYAV